MRLLVAAVSLMLLFCLSASCARAGSYVWTQTDPVTHVTTYSPTYSGGVTSITPAPTDPTQAAKPFTYSGGTYSGSASGYVQPAPGQSASLLVSVTTTTASGAAAPLVAKFTWLPVVPNDPGPAGLYAPAPPPGSSVIVQQHCRIDASEMAGPTTFTIQCNDGLGGSTSTQTGGIRQITLADSKYTAATVGADGTVRVSCSPSVVYKATTTTGPGLGVVSVSYGAAAYPVTVHLTGTTPDSSGGLNVLTGGQVTATLNCPFPVISYSWSVSGATAPNPFLTWDPTFPNSNYSTQFVPLASTDMTKDSFSFYDAHNRDSITVQCTATVQPPSGPALTVTAKSPNIKYIKPNVNWIVNQPYDSIPFGFFDGLPNGPFGSRELWGPITITEPPLFLTPGNPNTVGFGVVVQLASPSRSTTRVPLNGKPATYSKLSVVLANGTAGALSSPTGLDGAFPYYGGYYKNTDGTFTPVDGNYGWLTYNDGYSGDMPEQPYRNSDQDSGGNAWNASSASDSFDTWVMYRPASVAGQGTIYVPLQKLSWNWGATANLDQYNSWGVNQPQVFVSGSPAYTDVYPAWSLEIPLNPTIGP